MSSLAYFTESAEMLTSISFYQMLLEQKGSGKFSKTDLYNWDFRVHHFTAVW